MSQTLLEQVKQKIRLKPSYDNYINGEWVPPAKGQYFDNISPVTGKIYCRIARSGAEDIEKALDAAHGAAGEWGRTAAAKRAEILNAIADRLTANHEMLALAESWDKGKPLRESMAADLPIAI